MSDFNYIEYLKNNPLLKGDSSKLITESQEESKSSKMKKSELKAKIKEQILATLSEEDEEDMDDEDFDMPDPEDLYGDVAVSHGERAPYKPIGMEEAKKDEETADEEMDAEAEVDADVDMEADAEMTPTSSGVGLSAEEQEIQNNLKVAYDNAVAIGDQKLADQIGNSITFFTRTHVVER
jgi:hypothetical protein